MARRFVEKDHPRHPGGAPRSQGGRFRRKGSAAVGKAVDWAGRIGEGIRQRRTSDGSREDRDDAARVIASRISRGQEVRRTNNPRTREAQERNQVIDQMTGSGLLFEGGDGVLRLTPEGEKLAARKDTDWAGRIDEGIEINRRRTEQIEADARPYLGSTQGLGEVGGTMDRGTVRRYYDENRGEFRRERLLVDPGEAAYFYNDGNAGERRQQADWETWGHYIGERVQTSEGSGVVVGLYHNADDEEMVAVHHEGSEFDWVANSETFREGDPLSVLDFLADDAESADTGPDTGPSDEWIGRISGGIDQRVIQSGGREGWDVPRRGDVISDADKPDAAQYYADLLEEADATQDVNLDDEEPDDALQSWVDGLRQAIQQGDWGAMEHTATRLRRLLTISYMDEDELPEIPAGVRYDTAV